MTTTRYEQQERTIHAALTGSGGKVVRVDRGVWEFYPDRPDLPDLPGEFAPVEVRLRDNWVLCCSPVPSGLNGDLEGYALAMPALPGRCKVILDPADMTPRLREEILSVEGVDLAGACGSAIANLASAGALITRPSECRETRSGSMSAVPDEIVETLAEVSDASGWTFTEYGDGKDKEIVLAASQRSGGGGGTPLWKHTASTACGLPPGCRGTRDSPAPDAAPPRRWYSPPTDSCGWSAPGSTRRRRVRATPTRSWRRGSRGLRRGPPSRLRYPRLPPPSTCSTANSA